LNTTLRMGRTEWLLLLGLSVLWGASFFYKVMDSELPVFTVVLGRVGLAALALNLWLLARRDPMPTAPLLWHDFLVLGFLNCALPFCLYPWGETHITSGLASILNAATPIFTILVAQVFTQDEKMNWDKSAGVLLGFAGVGVLVGPDAFSDRGDLLAEAGCLCATLS